MFALRLSLWWVMLTADKEARMRSKWLENAGVHVAGFVCDDGSVREWLFMRTSGGPTEDGCRVAVTPLVLCGVAGGRVCVQRVRAKGFELAVHRDKACFGREFLLPPCLRGKGLGTYLLCRLVCFGVAHGCGDAHVRSLNLIARQDTPLRNAFYENMGFRLTVYRDGAGWARSAHLHLLRQRHDSAKVCDMPLFECPASVIRATYEGLRRGGNASTRHTAVFGEG